MNVAVEGERVNVLTLFPWFILGSWAWRFSTSVGLIPRRGFRLPQRI